MLIIISSAFIVAYTILFSIYTASKKHLVSASTGKCISMGVGMVSSTMIGLMLSILIPGELAYTTILSIFISSVCSYFTGKHFGINGMIETLSASFMGAMMGAMLGDMTPANRQTFIIVAMDIIYLLSILSLLFTINKEAVKQDAMQKTKLTPIFVSMILSISVLGIAVIMEANAKAADDALEMNHQHQH
ncbi:hypothetical protein [Niallia taxi]|uniref:hypothetical protein n=1 Tax=Niallia taxi TaxID=2499688 RepID=UPI002E205A6D|nr:hypothetical protein [Niallia taxi]